MALEARELREAGGQRSGQQEREEHLDARLHDAHLLQQLDQVAIAALQRRLVAAGPVEPREPPDVRGSARFHLECGTPTGRPHRLARSAPRPRRRGTHASDRCRAGKAGASAKLIAAREGMSSPTSTPTATAIAQAANATVKPWAEGKPEASTLEARIEATAAPPNAPPTVRVTAFMPVATPVCAGLTFSMIRLTIAANARPMPAPSSSAAR